MFYVYKIGTLRLMSSEVVSVIAAHPSAIYINRRGRRPGDPRSLSVTTAHSSIAQKRNLQKPSPVGEGAEERGG